MTFDPAALRAYLEATWEPRVWNIALAFLARPDLFGGGVLTGTRLDKLKLPDGRIFDLLVGSAVGGIRWWVSDVTNAPPGDGDDPYPLERGPVEFVDLTRFVKPPLEHVFEGLVGSALEEIAGADAVAAAAAGSIGESLVNEMAVEAAWAQEIVPAAQEIHAQLTNTTDVDIAGVVGATEGLDGSARGLRDGIPEGDEYSAPWITPPDEDWPPVDPFPEPGSGGRPTQ